MKRIIISLFLTVLILLPVSAFDFGGYFDNNSGLSTGDAGFSQLDKLSLWLGSGIGENLDFALQASYTFTIERPFLIDLDHLYLVGQFPDLQRGPSLFRFQAGRFFFSDHTKRILNHSIDGLELGFEFEKLRTAVTFGFTGLHLKPTSTILLSKADSTAWDENDVFLASPRLIGAFRLDLTSLFLDQTVTANFMFQEDLRNPDDLVEEGEEEFDSSNGGKVDTQYIGLGLSGRLVPGLFHKTFFSVGTGRILSYIEDDDSDTGFVYQYSPISSYLAGLNLNYYLESLLYSRFGLQFLLASGDADQQSFIEGNTEDNASLFIPVSASSFGSIFSPRPANLIVGEASYSLKPLSSTGSKVLENFQTMVKALVFFRTTTGAVSEAGVDTESKGNYLGTEIDGIINFRPFSDLGTSLTLGYFMPNADAFLDRDGEFQGKFSFSLSF